MIFTEEVRNAMTEVTEEEDIKIKKEAKSLFFILNIFTYKLNSRNFIQLNKLDHYFIKLSAFSITFFKPAEFFPPAVA